MNTQAKSDTKQGFWAREWNSIKHPSRFTVWYLSNFHLIAMVFMGAAVMLSER